MYNDKSRTITKVRWFSLRGDRGVIGVRLVFTFANNATDTIEVICTRRNARYQLTMAFLRVIGMALVTPLLKTGETPTDWAGRMADQVWRWYTG